MKKDKSPKRLFSRQELLEAANLSPQALEKHEEAGRVVAAEISGGVKYYSEETVAIIKAMGQCLGQCDNLEEAYEMAVQAVALKTRRDEQASRIIEDDHRGAIHPKKIRTHPTFKDLLPIDEDTLEEIARKMALYGYYESEPILLGKWPGLDHYVVIDGHTRRLAAIKAGIKKVFFVTQEFENESAALEHAMSLQADRRVTEDRHIFLFIERYDSMIKRGGDRRSEEAKSIPTGVGIETGRSASARRTASMVGCHYKKVEKVRKILKDAPAKIHNAVRKGKLTINKAYNATVAKGTSVGTGTSDEKPSSAKTKATKIQFTDENLAALKKLGGDLHAHVNKAIEGYLRYLRRKGLFPEKK